MNILSMNYYKYFVTKISEQYSIQKVIAELLKLQTPLQNKERTYFNKVMSFNKVLPYLFLYCKDVSKTYIEGVQKLWFADVSQNRCS